MGDAKDFISALLVANPKKRLTAKEALKHSWSCSVSVPTRKEKTQDKNTKVLKEKMKNKSKSVASTTNSINVEDAEVTGEITDLDEVVVNQKDSLKKKKK